MSRKRGRYFSLFGVYFGFEWVDSDYSWEFYTSRGDRRIELISFAFHGRVGAPWLLNIIVGPICFNAARILGKPIEKHPKDPK